MRKDREKPKQGEFRKKKPRRYAKLRPGSDESAVPETLRPLHSQKDRSSPFATNANALNTAEHSKNDRTPNSNHVIPGYKGDHHCRNSHEQERRDQRRLPTRAVAVMTKNKRAHWPSQEAHEINEECLQRTNQRIGIREKQLREHERGNGAIEEKVIPLNGCTDRASNDGCHQHLAIIRGFRRTDFRRAHR